MSFTVEVFEDEQSCKLILSGRLTVYNVKEFRDMILPITERLPTIILDLKDVSEFDSSFLQLFISLKNTAYQFGHIFKIMNHSKPVLQLMDVYGLIGFFSDKVVMKNSERKEYKFSYGTGKIPKTLR